MVCRFGRFDSSIYQIFHCPLFRRDCKVLALSEKNPLKTGISMLDIGTYAFDLPKISWKGWCLYDDTSLIRLFSITQ